MVELLELNSKCLKIMVGGWGRRMAMSVSRLAPPGLERLVGRQQSNHQPDQFAGGEYNGPFMLMFGHFVKFTFVVSDVLALLLPHKIGCFTEIVTQEAIAFFGERGVFGAGITGGGLSPFEAGIFSNFSFIIFEATEVADFSDDAGGKDRPDAGDGLQGVGDSGQLPGNGGVEPLLLTFQKRNVLQAEM